MDKRTVRAYNLMAREYDDETKDYWIKFSSSFPNKFSGNIKGNRKILDVGSGPGRDGLLLQKLGLKVICLDASESMTALSKKRG